MKTRFEKGQTVNIITTWNAVGDATIRMAIVDSCGHKRMTLRCALTDKMLGRDFDPNSRNVQSTTIDPVRFAEQLMAEYREKEIKRMSHCLTTGESEGYNRAIQKDLDTILSHTPVQMMHIDRIRQDFPTLMDYYYPNLK